MESRLDELAFSFFKLFAQYEYCLKERGFFWVDRKRNVYADWDRFANEVVGRNFREELGEALQAADYILDHPPKRQTLEEGRIVWTDVPSTDKSVQMLFGHICRVRNNLFHGAKFNGTWFDPVRSEALLESSYMILRVFQAKLHQEFKSVNEA